jgi:hypothetical protein
MRLWHLSRSGIIMTEPINWIEVGLASPHISSHLSITYQDHAVVIHVFTSLVLASKTNLRYDPTIKRVLIGTAPQYEVTLQDGDTNVTDGFPLCDVRANVTEGRATRVWKVYRKGGDQEDCFVLKDLWMFSDSKSEGDTMRDLLKKFDEKDHHYFLTVVSDGPVHVDGDLVDQTVGTIMRGIPTVIDSQSILPPHTYEESKLNRQGSRGNQSQGRPPGIKEACSIDLPEGGIIPRIHYRILFREVCELLEDIRDLGVVFSLLAQTANGELHMISLVVCF